MSVRVDSTKPRPDALRVALESALGGDAGALYAYLAKRSGLPGPRPNATLMARFGAVCASEGERVDRLLADMATLDADLAQGGTEFEFVPMCAVAAIGARLARGGEASGALLGVLHACAEDLRWRVRETVAEALARAGEARGEALAAELASWMDGFFQASAVLKALTDPRWLAPLGAHAGPLARLGDAFRLAEGAPRAASRYPGYKALLDALALAPAALAARFGAPVFDAMVEWCRVKDPALRDAVARNLASPRLVGRYGAELARVRAALDASAPARRDPKTYVGPTRARGKKANRRR